MNKSEVLENFEKEILTPNGKRIIRGISSIHSDSNYVLITTYCEEGFKEEYFSEECKIKQ